MIAENNALKETVAGLERERDFYFSKLRDIELLIQQAMEANPELEKDEDGILKQIQTILYSTEVSAGTIAFGSLIICGTMLILNTRKDSRFQPRWRASLLRRRRSNIPM